ncbi:hypothetical protein NLU13_2291 [Sarocladium strictum]|uniref:Uncharacterized protein n=1 Tax=Sarocladium strictum TaxID=5046 RepID=A0AA39GST4_SARSR|nr:hypothetical protein NLU13_2291 [Sarocladium strictum]
MSKRPGLLDLRANSHGSASSTGSRGPLRSPRLHIAGEAPPELSPLDAFALQSRLLARQLQEAARDGNRVSRLPPLTTESPLVLQGRSEYFRSMSQDSPSDQGDGFATSPSGLALKGEVEDAFPTEQERPKSMHPRMSRIPPTPDEAVPALPERDPSRGRRLLNQIEEHSDFGARRELSPSPIRSDTQSQHQLEASPRRRENSVSRPSPLQNESTPNSPEKQNPGSLDELGLAPPRTLFPKRSSSILSSPFMPADEDTVSLMGGSFHSLSPRKLSSGSPAFSHSVASPLGSTRRSPSVSSESSALPRPSFNFSRPMSRAGTPSFDSPTRQASSDSQPSFILADDSAHTPVSMQSEAFPDTSVDDGCGAAPSYIYSKFSLPRGKALQRSESDDAQTPSATDRSFTGAPPSPPTRPSSSSARGTPDDSSLLTRPSIDTSKPSFDSTRLAPGTLPPSRLGRPSHDTTRSSEEAPRGRPRTSPGHESGKGKGPASTHTSDTASTIRPATTTRSVAPSAAEMSAEEHLAKGIECHENGSLNESTYHLRHAARQNNPTAMLLYALACRHGWGMRANQREGVQWLRKAAEYASVEIAVDEDHAKEGKHVDVLDSRTRKAQFALSIYELGVSHMNGWGIEQDKALALRCFEIAGNWGDVDALAEAGFCYAQGVGCKKNLKKSAKFYRMAEAKGMSMVGNSWIHKAKYNDDEEKNGKKKARSKSRTRSIFARKPPATAAQ